MYLEILDSTLRDGEQGEGLNYFSTDKLAIFKTLCSIGFTFVEAGNPASNVGDEIFFKTLHSENLTSCSCSNRAAYADYNILDNESARSDVCPDNDFLTHNKSCAEKSNSSDDIFCTDGKTYAVAFTCTAKDVRNMSAERCISATLDTGCEWLSVVGKSSEKQVKNILRITADENLEFIAKTIEFFSSKGKSVIFDCEHFFDGYACSSEYSVKVIKTALSAGAKRIVLCDTNGGTFPDVIFSVTSAVCRLFPNAIIGIHCHNDNGMAVANTVMAVKGGARHIQGTLNGYGERCGNANLAAIIANLQLLAGYEILSPDNLAKLTSAAAHIAEISNTTLESSAPFVGHSAFTHKAGIHIDGMLKDNTGYEIIPPESVGNVRRIVLSHMSGKKAVENKLKNAFPKLVGNTELLEKFAAHIKQKESEGFIYEAAEASLILELHKLENTYSPLFELINYKVIIDYPSIDAVTSTVTLCIKVDDHTTTNVGRGNGPVNAIDKALRSSLLAFYPFIAKTSLVDYKVRVINPEATTGALVRVLITTTDGARTWSTVGVSSDIIEASWQALRDSIEYAAILV